MKKHIYIDFERPIKQVMDELKVTEPVEMFSLFFEEIPTYTQIVSGTPKLTFPFNVKSDFLTNKSDIAGDVGIGPTLRRLECLVLPLY